MKHESGPRGAALMVTTTGASLSQPGDSSATARVTRARRWHRDLHDQRSIAFRCEVACRRADGEEAVADHHLGGVGQHHLGLSSTFGLSDGELRSHANQLYRQGWLVAEILAVLDVVVPG